jgi:hypothetical protein
MRSKPVAALMINLEVAKPHIRPLGRVDLRPLPTSIKDQQTSASNPITDENPGITPLCSPISYPQGVSK